MNIKEALSKFISIRTDHPKPDYKSCIKFLKKLADQYKFPYEVIHLIDNKSAILIKYDDRPEDDEGSILFNCHMDVVPAPTSVSTNNEEESSDTVEKWNTDPFKMTTIDGKHYGRGTQDMKSLGMMYFFALVRLKKRKITPTSNIIISFVPEEEVMGIEGMNLLVDKLPKIKFGFDEGIPSELDNFVIYNGERKPWWIKMFAKGQTGHGSKYIKDSSVDKLMNAVNYVTQFNHREKKRHFDDGESLSKVSTLNLTYLNAGNSFAYNSIPDYCEAGFDIRITPEMDLDYVLNLFEFCKETFSIDYEFQKGTDINKMLNPTTDLNNPYIKLVEETLNDMKIRYEFDIFPASTDAKYLRSVGIPVIGISPIRDHHNLLHDYNEYISDDSLNEGVKFYYYFLKKLQ